MDESQESCLGAYSMNKRELLVTAARSCLETPFHHQGRQKGIALDCAGLLLHAAAEAGIPHVDFPNRAYSRWPIRDGWLRRFVAEQTVEIDFPRSREGSILLFWCYRPNLPQHLAILTEAATIVHAWYDAGKVVESELHGWHDKIVGVYDFKGVD